MSNIYRASAQLYPVDVTGMCRYAIVVTSSLQIFMTPEVLPPLGKVYTVKRIIGAVCTVALTTRNRGNNFRFLFFNNS